MASGICGPKRDDKNGKKPEKVSHSKVHANAPATVTTTTKDVVAPGEFGSEAKAVINKKRSAADTMDWDNLQESLKKN